MLVFLLLPVTRLISTFNSPEENKSTSLEAPCISFYSPRVQLVLQSYHEGDLGPMLLPDIHDFVTVTVASVSSHPDFSHHDWKK